MSTSRFREWLRVTNQGESLNFVIKELKELCRVNPDFNSSFRNDLEFYIPQLCTFLLKGDLEDPAQLFDFILMASSADFYFAHRVWFFLESGMLRGMSATTILEAQKVLRGLKCLSMSPHGNPNELLFVANSQEIMRLISELNLGDFYPQLGSIMNTFKRQYLERGSAASQSSRTSRDSLRTELERERQRDRANKARKLFAEHTAYELAHAEGEYTEELNRA